VNRKHYTKPHDYNNLNKEKIGGHMVEKIPAEISLTINKFVKDRPQKNRGINIDIFLTRQPLQELITTKKIGKEKSLMKIHKIIKSVQNDSISNRCIIYFTSLNKPMSEKYEQSDGFLLGIDDSSFCLVTNYKRIDHDKFCKWLINHLFPIVNKAFLTSSEMYNVLIKMEKQGKYDLRVIMNYEKIKELERSRIEYQHPGKPDNLPTIEEIFKEKKINKSYMRMMKIISISKEKDFGITFTGDGHVGIYDGTFDEVFDFLLIPTIELAKQKLTSYKDRSMSRTADRNPKPLLIEFYTNIFGTKDDAFNFINNLNKNYNRFSYAIVHSGNPHLFMYILDRFDYSSFSIRSVENNTLVITPQIKTSAESLMRFIGCILSLYPDGEIFEVSN